MKDLYTKRIGGIQIPNFSPEFVSDLILQRTGEFLKIDGGRESLQIWFNTGNKEALFRVLERADKVEEFTQRTIDIIAQDVRQLINDLPTGLGKRLMSIGPGNGIFEAILIANTNIKSVLLIDIESSTEHDHGYNSKGSGYASLENARALVMANVPEGVEILTCNPTYTSLPRFEYDTAISILSMGFHYPCDDYADYLSQNAAAGSKIVIDKRKGTQDKGFDSMKRSHEMGCLNENAKSARLVFSARN